MSKVSGREHRFLCNRQNHISSITSVFLNRSIPAAVRFSLILFSRTKWQSFHQSTTYVMRFDGNIAFVFPTLAIPIVKNNALEKQAVPTVVSLADAQSSL
jgi:hypothetical protein